MTMKWIKVSKKKKKAPQPTTPGASRTTRTLFWLFAFLLFFSPIALHTALGVAVSPVLTGSMKPTANPGDLLITKQVEADHLKVGDIAVLRNPTDQSLYSHRIKSITEQAGNEIITTMGDNNPAPDAFKIQLANKQSVPVSFFTVRFMGWPIVAFTSHIGKIAALILMGLALLLAGALFFTREKSLHGYNLRPDGEIKRYRKSGAKAYRKDRKPGSKDARRAWDERDSSSPKSKKSKGSSSSDKGSAKHPGKGKKGKKGSKK